MVVLCLDSTVVTTVVYSRTTIFQINGPYSLLKEYKFKECFIYVTDVTVQLTLPNRFGLRISSMRNRSYK